MMDSRLFQDVNGSTVTAQLDNLRGIPTILFTIELPDDGGLLDWHLPFSTEEDAIGAMDHITEALVTQIVSDAIEFQDGLPW